MWHGLSVGILAEFKFNVQPSGLVLRNLARWSDISAILGLGFFSISCISFLPNGNLFYHVLVLPTENQTPLIRCETKSHAATRFAGGTPSCIRQWYKFKLSTCHHNWWMPNMVLWMTVNRSPEMTRPFGLQRCSCFLHSDWIILHFALLLHLEGACFCGLWSWGLHFSKHPIFSLAPSCVAAQVEQYVSTFNPFERPCIRTVGHWDCGQTLQPLWTWRNCLDEFWGVSRGASNPGNPFKFQTNLRANS